MNIGKLNKRIILRTYAQTTDGTGFVTNGAATDTTVWASVKPVSAKRNIEEGREFSDVSFDIMIRYDANVITNIGDYQIVHNSNVLKVHSFFNVDEDNVWIKIVAVKG